MQLAMIGLGRMGANMARRLLAGGHEVVVHDRTRAAIDELAGEGALPAYTPAEVVAALRAPRCIWLMVPAGAATETALAELAALCAPGDLLVDGGNTHLKDDLRRARELAARGLTYADVGTSGGVWGRERGYCLMFGGARADFERLEPALRTLAPGGAGIPPAPGRTRGGSAELGYLHCGPSGAGHFVKMVHNGIEYGIMQAYAEGFDLLRCAAREELPAEQRYDFELAEISELWRRGSVVGSWLLDLAAAALAGDPRLEGYEGHVPDSGEGRWCVEAAVESAVPAEVLSAALFARFRSRQTHTFAEKLLSALRAGFGGHTERPGAR
jgi:6-phosphogluconate dehydrogenase